MRASGLAVLALLALVTLPACPGQLDDPDRFNGKLCPDPPDLFARRCIGMGCHEGDEPAAGLDLVLPGVEERLVGVSAAGDDCYNMGTLVDPGDPESSILYQKLGPVPPCGAAMPMTGTALTEVERQCVLHWIRLQ